MRVSVAGRFFRGVALTRQHPPANWGPVVGLVLRKVLGRCEKRVSAREMGVLGAEKESFES